jgi:hypothetical protein
LFLRCEKEAVVIEAKFAESDSMAGLFSKIFEGGEKSVRAAWVGVEVLCRAGMDAYSRVAEPS